MTGRIPDRPGQPIEAQQALSFDGLLDDCWQSLRRGSRTARHPFHTAVLGTLGLEGPELRTVVLREVDPQHRLLVCHTDRRSGKLEQLRNQPRVGWLFYDARRKIQLRLTGAASAHVGDTIARARWEASAARSRRCYGVEPGPGATIPSAGSGLPEALNDRTPKLDETEAWFDRFAVIQCRVDRLDWLWLRARGHRRARFRWDEGGLTSNWVVP